VTDALDLTGERTVPGAAGETYWFARHEIGYRWLRERYRAELAGGVVVDAGSGEGYGAALLGEAGPRLALALELDDAASRHAGAAYPTVSSVRANLVALPVRAGVVDLVVSLQVVEHLWDLPGFLRECTRVLRPGGWIAVTTPNRPVFSPGLGRGERPTNPFHVQELDAEQLAELLQHNGFQDVTVGGVRNGDRIEAWERAHGTGLVQAQVAAVTGVGHVPADTDRFVASCTVADFRVSASAFGAQDLVALAVRP
jgi:SAM-dependent methyltransferase